MQSNNSQTPGQFDREAVSSQIDRMAIFETVDLIQGGECDVCVHMCVDYMYTVYRVLPSNVLQGLCQTVSGDCPNCSHQIEE